MATSRVVAHRYARAVMDIAREQNVFDQVTDDVRTIRFAIDHSADLRNLLATPIVDVRVKEKIIQEIFKGKVGPVMERFITLLTSKGRSADLPEIVTAYQRLLDESQNIVPAKVVTAVPLNDSQRRKVEEKITAMSGRGVRAEYQVDPALIGGFTVKFEDRMIDASVRHQLERLRESLVGAPMN